ncbi:ATP-binding cassette domain-containing protein [Micromonospora sp. NPDC047620]|uniref:ATP-binding cassette domain-containing protein n=1 Tax=Micromonospora sp. NPDC047620 TaxID=3364251 RepID=UPI00371C4B03
MTVIECERLRHAYPPSHRSAPAVPVLDGVHLTITAGERVALVGRSGSGRSTLVRALLALEPVEAGTIRCEGRDVTPGPVHRLRWYRRGVQYVPQDPGSTLDPRARVLDIVAEPIRRLCGVTDRARLTAAAVRRPVDGLRTVPVAGRPVRAHRHGLSTAAYLLRDTAPPGRQQMTGWTRVIVD